MKASIKFGALLLGSALILQGCNDDKGDDMMEAPRAFNIEIHNLTNHQAFAPAGAVIHKEGYHAYTLGSMASTELEQLAEGGDNSALLATADSDDRVITTASGAAVIAPGSSEIIQMQGLGGQPRLTLVAMLVNTNDGFIGLDGIDISDLAMNESVVLRARVYDAGTEANDEAAAHLPGQGGEGYNAARDDRDFVAVHPGVVSMDDSLTSSALDQSHRFDNPGAKIVVTRTQ